MADRYFVSEPLTGNRVRLSDEEAHHLAHVMRVKPGYQVVLFDGSGDEWQAQVTAVGRAEVELQLLTRQEVDRELACDLTLAVALPKGDRQRWLVEKAVELGVRRMTPLTTARGVVQVGDASLARLRRTVIEASKQCGRNRLMEISAPANCADYFAAVASQNVVRVLADPGGNKSLASMLRECNHPLKAMAFTIGPEGGFTDSEISMARRQGWSIVTLGPRTLRVETAALYLVAAVALLAELD